jgi:hypothetical protein
MAFGHRASRLPHPPRVVLAVGQRVFVHGASAGGMVVLTDTNGVSPLAGLADGTEVEVLAWRPRGSAGTRYRVCDRVAGADGWLAADQLRVTAARPVSEPSAPPAPVADPVARPFGRT